MKAVGAPHDSTSVSEQTRRDKALPIARLTPGSALLGTGMYFLVVLFLVSVSACNGAGPPQTETQTPEAPTAFGTDAAPEDRRFLPPPPVGATIRFDRYPIRSNVQRRY